MAEPEEDLPTPDDTPDDTPDELGAFGDGDVAQDEDVAALAAEWAAAMGGGDGDDDEDAASRILSQDEIDSLLGVTASVETERTGIHSLLDNRNVSYERLPMLEVVFDRLVRIMSTNLRNFLSENVEISVDRVDSMRFSDYMNAVPLPALIGVFRAVEWDNYGLITVEGGLIYSVVDVLLGGRRGTAPARIEGRGYTTIERSLVERLIMIVLQDMAAAFEPLSKVQFKFERLETNPRFAAIARPTNAAILFKLRVEMEDRGGSLEILLPHATLEPVRDLLLQMFMGEKFGRDSIWEHHLAREMLGANVELSALLDEQMLPLGSVMSLKPGMTLRLNIRPDSEIDLCCGAVPLARGRIGRVGDHLAIRVDRRLDRRGEQHTPWKA